MTTPREDRQQRQLDAIWKWRWLGFRDSTPAFKVSLAALGLAAIALAVVATR